MKIIREVGILRKKVKYWVDDDSLPIFQFFVGNGTDEALLEKVLSYVRGSVPERELLTSVAKLKESFPSRLEHFFSQCDQAIATFLKLFPTGGDSVTVRLVSSRGPPRVKLDKGLELRISFHTLVENSANSRLLVHQLSNSLHELERMSERYYGYYERTLDTFKAIERRYLKSRVDGAIVEKKPFRLAIRNFFTDIIVQRTLQDSGAQEAQACLSESEFLCKECLKHLGSIDFKGFADAYASFCAILFVPAFTRQFNGAAFEHVRGLESEWFGLARKLHKERLSDRQVSAENLQLYCSLLGKLERDVLEHYRDFLLIVEKRLREEDHSLGQVSAHSWVIDRAGHLEISRFIKRFHDQLEYWSDIDAHLESLSRDVAAQMESESVRP